METGDLYLVAPPAEPRLFAELTGQRVHAVGGGFDRTVVISSEGAALGITHSVEQLAALEGQLTDVSLGKTHMAALTRSGEVYTLGAGKYGNRQST